MAQTEGEIYHVLGLEESIMWKWLFNKISIKLLMALFTELEQKNCTICMETQKTI